MSAANTAARQDSSARYALAGGSVAAAIVMMGIYIGSRRLRDFDAALVSYAGASVFSAFGLGYRYTMWLRRPPTRMYWRRGWAVFFARFPLNVLKLFPLAWENLIAQRFIERRSRLRWFAHLFIAWGCLLAASVTFPLSFGWVRFEARPDAQTTYRAFVSGFRVFEFAIDGPLAPIVFNVLDIAAVMVMIGIGLAFWRRGRDRGALALQQFGNDLLPLLLLFAVSVTGIFLTVSNLMMRGVHYAFLAELHAVTVIFTLLYLPFGKFFHVFQRPAQLSIKFYKEAGAREAPMLCARCHGAFATQMHVRDLKQVQRELGIRFEQAGSHYQDICPACRRKMVAIAQDALWRTARTGADAGG